MAIHSSHPIVDRGGRVAVTPWNAVQYTTCHVAALACPLTRARPCYLAQATRLVESIQHICLVFGSQPPLFKRASTTNTYQPQSLARTVSCCINAVSACACKALTPLGASLQQNTQALRSRIESTLQGSMRRVLEQQRGTVTSHTELPCYVAPTTSCVTTPLFTRSRCL